MNNRQRLMATLVKQVLSGKLAQQACFMEEITPLFRWAKSTFKQHKIFGSDYFGREYPGGGTVNGVRHEDVECLSFPDASLDLIISNDVFEHVPTPAKAFSECARVLKSGGVMLATMPFHRDNDLSVVRSKANGEKVEHVLPPVFHGNPVCADKSLVFTDFGWDVLSTIRQAGFADVGIDFYTSEKLGHLGGGQLVFSTVK